MICEYITLFFVISSNYFVNSQAPATNDGFRLVCYTCMSENVPQISKDIMRQTINIPDYAESRSCNDPFMEGENALANGIRMEPCDSACIKVVSENKYLRVVLRGCLNKLYSPGFLGFPLPDAQGGYQDTCDSQRQTSTGIGETVTDTCICTENYCNHAVANMKIDNKSCVMLFVGLICTFVMGKL